MLRLESHWYHKIDVDSAIGNTRRVLAVHEQSLYDDNNKWRVRQGASDVCRAMV